MKEPLVVKLAIARQAEGKSFKLYKNSVAARLEDLVSYNTYWKPLAKRLEGMKTVHLAGHGVYHQISFSSLLNPESKKYLADEVYVASIPSTEWLVKPKHKRAIPKVTLLAHPAYGAPASSKPSSLSRSLDLENINELPGTENELNDIVALVDRNKIGYKEFEGPDASEENVRKIAQPEVLHIATHGYFLNAISSTETQFRNPLLQSGLLLAGCQLKPHLTDSRKEDGILTAYEASTLPLYQTTLVILSACETGLGDVKNGEGVYGLQRAFLMAGAQRVLMSLWKVDDESTRQFMVAFYEDWIQSQDIDRAYQTAQRAVRLAHPEPYYWAAFILNGQ